MSDAGNIAYLQSVCAELLDIPFNIAQSVASEVFKEAVQQTRVDSGNAAANWHYQPYKGSPGAMAEEVLMWGFGSVTPISPVGYKWSKTDNSEAVIQWQFENLATAMTLVDKDIDGILIYNPITAGFSGFQPGTDYFYPDNAFAALNMDEIVSSAMERAYAEYGNARV